jgi:hypothetical protein
MQAGSQCPLHQLQDALHGALGHDQMLSHDPTLGIAPQPAPEPATAHAQAAPDPSARSRRLPGPPALPLLGNLPHFLWHGDLADMLASFSSTYGPVSRAMLRGRPIVFVSDPRLVREVRARAPLSPPHDALASR